MTIAFKPLGFNIVFSSAELKRVATSNLQVWHEKKWHILVITDHTDLKMGNSDTKITDLEIVEDPETVNISYHPIHRYFLYNNEYKKTAAVLLRAVQQK